MKCGGGGCGGSGWVDGSEGRQGAHPTAMQQLSDSSASAGKGLNYQF